MFGCIVDGAAPFYMLYCWLPGGVTALYGVYAVIWDEWLISRVVTSITFALHVDGTSCAACSRSVSNLGHLRQHCAVPLSESAYSVCDCSIMPPKQLTRQRKVNQRQLRGVERSLGLRGVWRPTRFVRHSAYYLYLRRGLDIRRFHRAVDKLRADMSDARYALSVAKQRLATARQELVDAHIELLLAQLRREAFQRIVELAEIREQACKNFRQMQSAQRSCRDAARTAIMVADAAATGPLRAQDTALRMQMHWRIVGCHGVDDARSAARGGATCVGRRQLAQDGQDLSEYVCGVGEAIGLRRLASERVVCAQR